MGSQLLKIVIMNRRSTTHHMQVKTHLYSISELPTRSNNGNTVRGPLLPPRGVVLLRVVNLHSSAWHLWRVIRKFYTIRSCETLPNSANCIWKECSSFGIEQRIGYVWLLYGLEFNLVFLNEELFISLDEVDELDRINYAWIGFNDGLHKHRKHSSTVVRVADSYASDLGSILGQGCTTESYLAIHSVSNLMFLTSFTPIPNKKTFSNS